jgi:hypothetical protein
VITHKRMQPHSTTRSLLLPHKGQLQRRRRPCACIMPSVQDHAASLLNLISFEV